MNMLSISMVISLVFSSLPPVVRQGQGVTLASRVERMIKEKEPEWVLARTCFNGCGGRRSPDEEEDSAIFEWKRKGSRASVSTYKMKTEEKARVIFNVSTMTPVMREGYRPNHEGEALKGLVDAVGFYKNKSRNGYVESYDATFRKGKVVFILRAGSASVAQRFALHIADALPAT